MNVMLAADDTLIDGLELVLWTLLTHNKHVNIYIATMNITIYEKEMNAFHKYNTITKEHRDWLTRIVKYLDYNSEICFLDCEECYHNYLEGGVNEDTYFTPFASLRLLADKLIPDIDDLLYLDCDTAVQANLEPIYRQCIYNSKMDYAASFAYDAFDGKGEMVSGVLIFNLARMRDDGFLDKARENYKTNKYKYPDQMAIRDAGDCIRLPESYGYMEPLENCYYTPAILHFTNNLSPKIYSRDIPNIKDYFYKRYPQFKFVKDGLEMLKKIILYT